ncbi:fasciclin domain-containing protein [Methanosarcina sp. Mfa9]|uniref:fasciclin domain-containing protein n=1 Tax=Methanosarcina sp. Mfa9 TaxID=3439063 RepID=UPI003F850E9B
MLFASGCAEETPEEEGEEPVDEVTEEEVVEEEAAEEEMADEEIAEEEMADEEIAEEEMADEEMADEEMADEEMADEEIADEEMADEEIADEEMADEEMADEEMADEEMADEEMADEEMDIVETAAESGDFDTLVTAVQTAGLEEALSGEGPFTVFAPTDEAFDALPPGTLDDLLADEDALTNVLLYHVAEGEFDVTEIESVETMQGEELPVDPTSDPITVGDANIMGDRIVTSNGFIYPIDTVLIPPE